MVPRKATQNGRPAQPRSRVSGQIEQQTFAPRGRDRGKGAFIFDRRPVTGPKEGAVDLHSALDHLDPDPAPGGG